MYTAQKSDIVHLRGGLEMIRRQRQPASVSPQQCLAGCWLEMQLVTHTSD